MGRGSTEGQRFLPFLEKQDQRKDQRKNSFHCFCGYGRIVLCDASGRQKRNGETNCFKTSDQCNGSLCGSFGYPFVGTWMGAFSDPQISAPAASVKYRNLFFSYDPIWNPYGKQCISDTCSNPVCSGSGGIGSRTNL